MTKTEQRSLIFDLMNALSLARAGLVVVSQNETVHPNLRDMTRDWAKEAEASYQAAASAMGTTPTGATP